MGFGRWAEVYGKRKGEGEEGGSSKGAGVCKLCSRGVPNSTPRTQRGRMAGLVDVGSGEGV